MSGAVERLERELRDVRLENDALRADNYALRARLSACACGAATAQPPTPPACDEQQLDLISPKSE